MKPQLKYEDAPEIEVKELDNEPQYKTQQQKLSGPLKQEFQIRILLLSKTLTALL